MAKILIVEDEKNQRTLYEQELGDDGYDIVTAATGHEAVAMVKDDKDNGDSSNSDSLVSLELKIDNCRI